MKNLPLPDLNDEQAARLHALAVEAAELSRGVRLDELDAYLELIDGQKMAKAGFLGVGWSDADAVLDRDELAASRAASGEMRVGEVVFTGDTHTLELLRLALLAAGREEIAVADVQDTPLPEDTAARERIARETSGLAARLDETKERMRRLAEEMDDVVADGLGLDADERDLIRRRCLEFPLSVTVGSPRYVWSADRKRQARRTYRPGERFR